MNKRWILICACMVALSVIGLIIGSERGNEISSVIAHAFSEMEAKKGFQTAGPSGLVNDVPDKEGREANARKACYGYIPNRIWRYFYLQPHNSLFNVIIKKRISFKGERCPLYFTNRVANFLKIHKHINVNFPIVGDTVYKSKMSALLFKRNLILPDHGGSGLIGVLNSFTGKDNLLVEQHSTESGDQRRYGGYHHRPKPPSGGVFLGVKVLSGFGLLLCGLYGFGCTLHRILSYSIDAGLKRAFLFTLVMFAGGYLIASSFYTQGSPRCVDYGSEAEQRQNAKECF